MVAMFVDGSGQNEHSLERTFHRCFLPSFTSFGWGVSEGKIKMWKVNGRQTTDAKWWPKAMWAKNQNQLQISMINIKIAMFLCFSFSDEFHHIPFIHFFFQFYLLVYFVTENNHWEKVSFPPLLISDEIQAEFLT